MSPEVNSAQSQPKDQVPRRKRFLWGLGGFTDATITYGLNGMVNVIYINALAVNAVLAFLCLQFYRPFWHGYHGHLFLLRVRLSQVLSPIRPAAKRRRREP